MADEVLGVAQIEIVASLAGLDSDLEAAREAVSQTADSFESALGAVGGQMISDIVYAGGAKDAWLSLGDAALRLVHNIEDLVLQLTVLNPLLNTLSGGDNSLPTLTAGSLEGLLGGMPGLAGFAWGGDFEVDGSAGIDSSLVAFRATPGEHVSIMPANDRGPVGGTAVTNVNVVNNSGVAASVEERPNARGGKDITVIIGEMNARDIRTNGPLARAIRQQYGAETVPIQR